MCIQRHPFALANRAKALANHSRSCNSRITYLLIIKWG